MRNKNVLNRIKALEEKANDKENDGFIRYVYSKLVFSDMSDQRLREIINLDKSDLDEVSKEIDVLIDEKMKKVKFKDIDKKLVEGLKRTYFI
ncbi:hypothetical protein DOK76_03735 [Vagococcus sp. DIV0080]|uniref:Uncharacterized protein n=1 Tax=Candidatus Vagococcus giribetii TaxID=2230876 RepID=A0ABS3HR04_9ENTE|nr:hypothetical protein [Vagococcus sp. DIV0080]MBO0476167.1 hypothetical protein [Vagococcus sp. DIV0080]